MEELVYTEPESEADEEFVSKDPDRGRRTGISLTYNGENLSKQLKPFIEEFTYTDPATGESDRITLRLNNRSGQFMKNNKPVKSDKMTAAISMHNYTAIGETQTIKCGKFVIDDLVISGSPSMCEIGAVSIPAHTEFKNRQRSKTYKNVTVKEIANTVAKRAGIALHYDADVIRIKEIEQDDTSDSEFLSSVCADYGLGIKVYSGKIVIYDEEKYEKKNPVTTIKRLSGNIINWSWNTTLQRTYTGAKVSYSSPSGGKKQHITIGKKGRYLDVTVTAFSKKDAELKAKALLANENKKRTTMQITMLPTKPIYATSTVKIEGFGKLSGKYFVDKVTHEVREGYLITVNLRKVGERS